MQARLEFRIAAVLWALSAWGASLPAATEISFRLQSAEVGFEFDSLTLGSRTEIIEQVVVNEQGQEVVIQLPGSLAFENVILTRPVDRSTAMSDWRAVLRSGDLTSAKRDFVIIVMDAEGREISRWRFNGGWPADLDIRPRPDGSYEEILTVAFDDLFRIDLSLPNQPPEISLPGSFSIAVGETAQFMVTSTDPDGDIAVLTQLIAPLGATFVDGVFTWEVPIGAIESANPVEFEADDLRGQANSLVTSSLMINVPRDLDADNMDDDWEVIWFGSIRADPDSDSDNDGISEAGEFDSGTDPTDPTSAFRIIRIGPDGEDTAIVFLAQPGIRYQLQYNDNKLDTASWQKIGLPYLHSQPGSALHMLIDDTRPPEETRFYRIEAQRR